MHTKYLVTLVYLSYFILIPTINAKITRFNIQKFGCKNKHFLVSQKKKKKKNKQTNTFLFFEKQKKCYSIESKLQGNKKDNLSIAHL